MFLYLFTRRPSYFFFFFFNDTATTEIYTLSLHDALPIYCLPDPLVPIRGPRQGSRFLLCRQSSFLRDWLANRRLAARDLMAWPERLEMAVYPGRHPRDRIRGDHDLLPDRLASAGSLTACGRAVLDHRTITARKAGQEESSSFLQHLGSSAQPGCNPADPMLFLRHDRKLRDRFLAPDHSQTPLWTE